MRFTPKKSLGQNFLNDKNIISSIVDIGEIKENDIIIEVGPGSGVLTEKILNKRPKKLTVIEKDEELVKILKVKFGNKSLLYLKFLDRVFFLIPSNGSFPNFNLIS